MNKELVVVYQDCPTCGNRKKWGEKTIEAAKQSGLDIRFVSFAIEEGQKLCKEAIYAGVGKLPFITDGIKFSDNIEDFVKVAKKKKAAKKKSSAKKVVVEEIEEVDDGQSE